MDNKNKILITDKIIADVSAGKGTINEVLKNEYYGTIQDKIKEKEEFKNMTPMQMALFDAGVTRNTLVGSVINDGYSVAGAGHLLVPTYIESTLKEFIDKNDILSYVVGNTQMAQAQLIQAPHLDMTDEENKKATKKARVSEGADLPLAKITLGESGIRLFKHGRAVEQTYESMLLMTIDMFTKTLDLIANDASNQELDRAVEILANGDGNKNPAVKLGATVGADITSDELIDALSDFYFLNNRPATTIVAGKKIFKNLQKLVYNREFAFGANARYAINTPQVPTGNINLVYADVPQFEAKDVALIFNKEDALTKYVLQGSNIREYDNNIRNQTSLGTISEIAGFAKNIKDCVGYLQLGK